MERKNPQCLNCFLNNADFIHYIPSPVFGGRERVSGSCFLIGHRPPPRWACLWSWAPAGALHTPAPCSLQREAAQPAGSHSIRVSQTHAPRVWCAVWKCVPSITGLRTRTTRLMISGTALGMLAHFLMFLLRGLGDYICWWRTTKQKPHKS